MQASLNCPSSTSELFWKYFNLHLLLKAALPFQSRCYLENSPATCFVLGKSVWQVLPLPGVPGSCALYYQSVFIAVFTFTALPGTGSLWTTHAFATCITPPRFAKPCPTVAKGSSGQLPQALQGLESTNYEGENILSS